MASLECAAQNVPVQWTFHAACGHPASANTIELDAVVTEPGGRSLRVPGFWGGGDLWHVRYASDQVGRHTFRTECSDATDAGLHAVAGCVDIVAYRGDNVLYRHGAVRVAADLRHFQHADGTPFFWLGDTWWMGLCRRLRFPDEFQALIADRVAKGFTVVQIVAGLYPDMPPFDERGANEQGFPWTEDYGHIRPEYFDAADRRIVRLVESGLVPCIVGAWGYFLPWLGVARARRHWRNLVARYGAYPVLWCVAGEANLPYYLTPGFPFDDRQQAAGWTDVARYVREIDPFRRPLSVHPTGLGALSARGATTDPAVLDFDMLQTGHGRQAHEALPPAIRTLRASRAAEPAMPVLNSEVSYEALFGAIPAGIQRLVFWASMLSGAAGHTYGANGIWQVNRRAAPHGPSPHGADYGTIPWDEAMILPGSGQLGLAKAFLQRLPWHTMEPHPEWACFPGGPLLTEENVPYAAGIAEVVRVIYAPCRQPLQVRDIEPAVRYRATLFDPASGEESSAGAVRPDPDGTWNCVPAAGSHPDWVLLLEAVDAASAGDRSGGPRRTAVSGAGPGPERPSDAKP